MEVVDPYKNIEKDFLAKYPPIKSLNIWSRFKAWFAPKSSQELVAQGPMGNISIWGTVVTYKGVAYFVRWGKLPSKAQKALK